MLFISRRNRILTSMRVVHIHLYSGSQLSTKDGGCMVLSLRCPKTSTDQKNRFVTVYITSASPRRSPRVINILVFGGWFGFF